MESIAHVLLALSISIAIYSINIQRTTATLNFLYFERVQCIGYPKSDVKFTKCIAKLISRDRLRVHMEATFNRTIKSFFIHSSAYYQFSSNEYRPFLFDVWEDFCGYMSGDKAKNLFMSLFHPKFIKYTNFNHTCPYKPGVYEIKFENTSVNALDSINLLPAGRFRFELSYHVGFKGVSFGMHKIFFRVSDHRIEQF